jgi:hypothetical protein
VSLGGGFILQVTRAAFKAASNDQSQQQQQQQGVDEGQGWEVAGGDCLGGMTPQEHQGGLGYHHHQQQQAPAPSPPHHPHQQQHHQQQQQLMFHAASSVPPVETAAAAERERASGVAMTEEQIYCEALPVESEVMLQVLQLNYKSLCLYLTSHAWDVQVYDYPVALIQNVYEGRNYSKLNNKFFTELEVRLSL